MSDPEDGIWANLGIAPTASEAEIRRAYAARLKAIDPDGTPAAFMRLRAHYEEALSQARASSEESVYEGHDLSAFTHDPPEACPGDRRQDRPDDDIHDTRHALKAFEAEFTGLLDARDVRAAMVALKAALAQGVISIGHEKTFADAITALALVDGTLSPDELDNIAKILGPSVAARKDDTSLPIRRDLRERAEALRWHARTTATASRGDGLSMGVLRRLFDTRIRIARAIRDPQRVGLRARDITAFSAEAARARAHAHWLSGRIEADLIEQRLRKTKQRANRIMVAALLLVFGPFVIIRLPVDRELASLAAGTVFCAGGLILSWTMDFDEQSGWLRLTLNALRWFLMIACLGIIVVIAIAVL